MHGPTPESGAAILLVPRKRAQSLGRGNRMQSMATQGPFREAGEAAANEGGTHRDSPGCKKRGKVKRDQVTRRLRCCCHGQSQPADTGAFVVTAASF